MRAVILSFFLLTSFLSFTQSQSDLNLLKKSIDSQKESKNESHFKGLLKVYNRAITDQIINDCIYQESCSNFGQHSFSNYGFGKGLFITFDRLMRCNRLSQIHVLPVRVNENGKIADPSEWYRK